MIRELQQSVPINHPELLDATTRSVSGFEYDVNRT
jgi:hypothetical protein